MSRFLQPSSLALILFLSFLSPIRAQTLSPTSSPTDLSHLVTALRAKANTIESSPATRTGFQSFISAHKLALESIRYSDYVVAHLLFEATLSAGSPVRVVVPTSQIFLTDADTFDTRKFDPWHQKTIYEYTRRDVPTLSFFPNHFSIFSCSSWKNMLALPNSHSSRSA